MLHDNFHCLADRSLGYHQSRSQQKYFTLDVDDEDGENMSKNADLFSI